MRTAPAFALILIYSGSGALAIAQTRAPRTPAYRVILHPSNPANAVDRKFLADAFLKKVTRWADDEVVRPVDLSADSPVRNEFCKEVLQRSVAAVKNYWQQLVFSGRDVPPPELDTDDDVVKYVLKHRGAIGYVSSDANLSGAKAVIVQ